MLVGVNLTHLSVWLALLLYLPSELGRLQWRQGRSGMGWWRCIATLACAFYVVHVISAFQVCHEWSHTSAYLHTAQQTEAVVGWNWGGGILVNYCFTAVWVSETLWWWLTPTAYRLRSGRIDTLIRGTFLFMIVNGAVIFVEGPRQWLGIGITLVLLVGWWKQGQYRIPD